MFRDMRIKKELLPQEDSIAILNRRTSGVLATAGDDDYPYAVPLSYVYYEGKIFFHGAKSGHKIDAIRRNPKVSFCVIDLDETDPEEYFTSFRSVIVFGKARILESDAEKRCAIELLARKYSPSDTEEHRNKAINRQYKALCMIELTIEHMTGKGTIDHFVEGTSIGPTN